jgi:hypothetical protein
MATVGTAGDQRGAALRRRKGLGKGSMGTRSSLETHLGSLLGRRASAGNEFGGGGARDRWGNGGLRRCFRPPRVDSVDEASASGEAQLQGTAAEHQASCNGGA